MSSKPTRHAVWGKLEKLAKESEAFTLQELFARDPERTARQSTEIDGIEADFSRHHVTEETFEALLALARAQELEAWRDRMFAGEKINTPKAALFCIPLCGRKRTSRFMWTGRTLFRRSGPFIKRWKPLSTMCARKMARRDRLVHSRCREYRDRRIRSGAAACCLRAPRAGDGPARAFCRERRCGGS